MALNENIALFMWQVCASLGYLCPLHLYVDINVVYIDVGKIARIYVVKSMQLTYRVFQDPCNFLKG